MLIVILGPDGSGKTTLAKGLVEKIDTAHYRYLGHNPDRKYAYGGKLIKSTENQKGLLHLVGKFLVLANDWVDHHTSKKELAIADRSSIDLLIGNQLFQRKSKVFYQWILPLYPKPDMVLLLKGDPELIYKRKPEHPPKRLKKLSQLYLNYLKDSSIPFDTIDTTQNSIRQAVDLGFALINNRLN